MNFNPILSISAVLALSFSPIMAHEGCEGKTEAKAGAAVQSKEISTGEAKVDYQARYPAIKREELVKAIEAKSVFLVDANGSESFNTGHIPGAINFESAGEGFVGMLPQDKAALIVAYCGGPKCQAWCKAADKLDELGYKNVKHFKGGIKEWKSAGLTVQKPAQDKKG